MAFNEVMRERVTKKIVKAAIIKIINDGLIGAMQKAETAMHWAHRKKIEVSPSLRCLKIEHGNALVSRGKHPTSSK